VTVSKSDEPKRGWLLRLQSTYVLPLARGIYLVIALLALVTMIGGGAYVLFLQASVGAEPGSLPLPPPYQGADPVATPSERSVDLALVQSRLEPPTKIQFVVTPGVITKPLSEGQVLGRFLAETPNKLAPFPDGVSLLGGRDAERFERVADSSSQAIALAARPALADEIKAALVDIQQETTRTFEIRVVARDRYGITSAPADLSFALKLAPAPAVIAVPAPESQAEPTPLQAIARDIARTVQPEVNPEHFAVYHKAIEVPGRCGASAEDGSFVSNYRRAFEEVRARLTTANVDAFYAGLCDAWKAVLGREEAKREQVLEGQRAAREAADAARAKVQGENQRRLQEHGARAMEAKVKTALILPVLGGALVTFLAIALVLAFLAIEGHSRAVRAAMEAMVRIADGRQTQSHETQGA
jgi:hypothetical protein